VSTLSGIVMAGGMSVLYCCAAVGAMDVAATTMTALHCRNFLICMAFTRSVHLLDAIPGLVESG